MTTRQDLKYDWINVTAQCQPLNAVETSTEQREVFAKLVNITFFNWPQQAREAIIQRFNAASLTPVPGNKLDLRSLIATTPTEPDNDDGPMADAKSSD